MHRRQISDLIAHQRIRSCNSGSFAVKDLFFFRVLQNELIPNQANITVKHIATTTRLGFALPPWYWAYSRKSATLPMAAKTRKTKPVTSSQRWCSTRPTCVAVMLPTRRTAPQVRVCCACRRANLARRLSLRLVARFTIDIDFINLRGYNSAA